MAPICTMTPMRSNCAQCSAILPSTTRLMSMPGMVTDLPVAGTPWKGPSWVPVMRVPRGASVGDESGGPQRLSNGRGR